MIGNATIRMIIRRLLLSVPLLFVVSVLTFGLVALTPGNPALEILGGSATPAEVTALDQQLGLNQPLVVQYGSGWSGRCTAIWASRCTPARR